MKPLLFLLAFLCGAWIGAQEVRRGDEVKHPRLAWLVLALVMVVVTALAVLIVVERCERNVPAKPTIEELAEVRR